MADGDQMLDQATRAGRAVADDEIAIRIGQRAVKQDERETTPQQRENTVARMVVCRREQKALDAVGDEVLDIFALKPQIAFAIAEEDAVPGPCGGSLRAAHHRSEERIDDVRHDKPDCLCLLRDQATGNSIRHVVECGDRFSRRFARVSASTPWRPLMTRETVIADTPARLPTSRNVTANQISPCYLTNRRC